MDSKKLSEYQYKLDIIVESSEIGTASSPEEIKELRESLATKMVDIVKKAAGSDKTLDQMQIDRELKKIAKELLNAWFLEVSKSNLEMSQANMKRFLFNKGLQKTAIESELRKNASIFKNEKVDKHKLLQFFTDVLKANNKVLFNQLAKRKETSQKTPTQSKQETSDSNQKPKQKNLPEIEELVKNLPQEKRNELISKLIQTYTKN